LFIVVGFLVIGFGFYQPVFNPKINYLWGLFVADFLRLYRDKGNISIRGGKKIKVFHSIFIV
tara:strand:- start:14434 stop:14619 length:186 start_codon:yes stop_codon:yes gene_type:complete